MSQRFVRAFLNELSHLHKRKFRAFNVKTAVVAVQVVRLIQQTCLILLIIRVGRLTEREHFRHGKLLTSKHDRLPVARELVAGFRSNMYYCESRQRPCVVFMGTAPYFQCLCLHQVSEGLSERPMVQPDKHGTSILSGESKNTSSSEH